MVAKPKVWFQFALVLVAMYLVLALGQWLPRLDFAIALAMKGVLVVASVALLWRMSSGDGGLTGVWPRWMFAESRRDEEQP